MTNNTPTAPDTGPTPDGQQTVQQALLERIAAAGLSLSELEAAGLLTAAAPTQPLLAALVEEGLTRLQRDHPGTYRTWAPYLRILAAGLPNLCPCACATCSSGPCPCAGTGHAAGCAPASGEVIDCAQRYPGKGRATAEQVSVDDVAGPGLVDAPQGPQAHGGAQRQARGGWTPPPRLGWPRRRRVRDRRHPLALRVAHRQQAGHGQPGEEGDATGPPGAPGALTGRRGGAGGYRVK